MSLYTSSMSSSESNTYRLRMYIDEDYNPQGDGGNLQFSVQVNVYGRDRVAEEASTVLLNNIPEENQYDDGVDTFITGEDPNNYIWYSGKLWRAVSVNNEANTTKLVTQWNISTIAYSSGSTDFAGSYMEEWLNDTTVDGFLGNLRDYEDFIVTDSVWDATMDSTVLGSIERPNGTSVVTNPVGALNIYEYQSSYNGTTSRNGYLYNTLHWFTITPNSSSNMRVINALSANSFTPTLGSSYGVRPSINLKSSIKIVDGNGTIDNPYRLEGDNDSNLSGTLLNTRYSGEYVRFGNDENNLYRIVSHENGMGTKISSAEPLKDAGEFINISFDSNDNPIYSSTNTMGIFLNGDYLTNYIGDNYSNMIEDNTTWYLGTVGSGESYKKAKYTDANMSGLTSVTTTSKVGLLRYGELMAGQLDEKVNNTNYWFITPFSSSKMNCIITFGMFNAATNGYSPSIANGVKPAFNLKSNVIITGGLGTKEQPFEIALQ